MWCVRGPTIDANTLGDFSLRSPHIDKRDACGLIEIRSVQGSVSMADDGDKKEGWSKAEREALRKLLRMALVLLLALIVAGTIAALLSAQLSAI